MLRMWEEFWGAPPGVSRRRWNNLRTMRMGGVVLVLIGLASSCFGILGIFGAGPEEPAVTPLAQAASASGERVRLAGRLHAANPVQMPDDGVAVIRGRVQVALAESGRGTVEVLLDWSEQSGEVVLTDGSTEIPVAVETLPMEEDRRARGSLTRTAVRGGQPDVAEYGGQTWDLDAESYDHGSWRLDVERELLAQDAQVVATGRMVDGRLAPSSGTTLRIEHGSATEVAESRGRTKFVLACVGPALFVLGLLLTIFATIRMAKARVAGVGRIGGMLS